MDNGILSIVRERRGLASGLVERLHRKGDAENGGELAFDSAIIGGDDCIYFVESVPGKEYCGEIVLNGDLEVNSRE